MRQATNSLKNKGLIDEHLIMKPHAAECLIKQIQQSKVFEPRKDVFYCLLPFCLYEEEHAMSSFKFILTSKFNERKT